MPLWDVLVESVVLFTRFFTLRFFSHSIYFFSHLPLSYVLCLRFSFPAFLNWLSLRLSLFLLIHHNLLSFTNGSC